MLFLSKLLPLLLYPLGLACGLLLLALVLLWRRPRWAAGAMVLALGLLLVSSNSWVATAMMRSLEWRHLPPSNLPSAEAIVVLGGGIKPQISPRPWVDVADEGDRVLHGARLYLAGKAPLLILSGGRISWGQAPERSEAADMALLALALGVPESAIIQEATSLNTHQNAVNVEAILQDKGIQRILLVTSAQHMPRALAIFKRQGLEAIPAATDFHVAAGTLDLAETTWQGRTLSLAPQASNLDDVTRSLKEYLGLGVYWLRGWL